MGLVLSAVVGATLGGLNAVLALRPLRDFPLGITPQTVAWRFLLRLLVLSVALAACIHAGLAIGPLVIAVVGGFLFQASRMIRRVLA